MTSRTLPGDPGDIRLTYTLERNLDEAADGSTPSIWEVDAHFVFDPNEDDLPHVGRIKLAIIDLEKIQDPYDVLDSLSSSLSDLGGGILDLKAGGLLPDLQEQLDETASSKIVLIDHVQLEPNWRGSGWLGVLLAGLAVEEVAGDCGMAFLLALPIHWPENDLALNVARKKLWLAWNKIGFDSYGNDVMFADLHLRKFWDNLATQRKNVAQPASQPAWKLRDKASLNNLWHGRSLVSRAVLVAQR